jgi:serralysin
MEPVSKPVGHLCTMIDAQPARLAGVRDLFWEPGSTITIGWMGGNSKIWGHIVRAAEMWTDYANINFEWLGRTNNAMIRIGFENSGSWSYVGKQNLIINQSRATMNFGWFNEETPWTEYRRTTVHEFGHMLGMIHEHQHPCNGIQWNKPVVYDYYAKNMAWSKDMVDWQIFRRYDEDTTQYSEFDPDSIMCYHIPAEFTLDGFTNGWNDDMSDLDRSWAKIIYPGRKYNVYLPVVSS